jgi:hypothetical protein
VWAEPRISGCQTWWYIKQPVDSEAQIMNQVLDWQWSILIIIHFLIFYLILKFWRQWVLRPFFLKMWPCQHMASCKFVNRLICRFRRPIDSATVFHQHCLLSFLEGWISSTSQYRWKMRPNQLAPAICRFEQTTIFCCGVIWIVPLFIKVMNILPT